MHHRRIERKARLRLEPSRRRQEVFIEANRRLRDVLAAKSYVFRYSEVPRNIRDPEHLRPTLPAGIVYLLKPAP